MPVAVLRVLDHQPEPPLLGSASIGVAIHRCEMSGLLDRTRTLSGLTPLVTEQPSETLQLEGSRSDRAAPGLTNEYRVKRYYDSKVPRCSAW